MHNTSTRKRLDVSRRFSLKFCLSTNCAETSSNVKHKRARIYDIVALLTAILVVVVDQWTKALVVANLGPPDVGPRVSLIGNYLILFYIRNNGAAFSLFSNSAVLIARIQHSGYVVDFISFRIPQIGFYFAIFNIADAAISVGVFLLFVTILFGSFHRQATPEQELPRLSDDKSGRENTLDSSRQSTS